MLRRDSVISSEHCLFYQWWVFWLLQLVFYDFCHHYTRSRMYTLSIWCLIHNNHKSSRVWFEPDSYSKNEKRNVSLRRLCSLSWVPASVQVWTLGLCVCWSASRRCRTADHIRDLKQPNRLVITANHDGGRIVREARRWLSVWRGEAKFVSLLSGNFSTAKPQQASQDHLNVFWQYFLFIAEEIRSVGKQNPQTCCLWVKLVNVNYVAWGAAVWLSKENKNAFPL